MSSKLVCDFQFEKLHLHMFMHVLQIVLFCFPALVENSLPENAEREKLFLCLAHKYKVCMEDMQGRAPG